jgi:hypothetical protein
MNFPRTFTITTEPFYDQYNKCYKNILMINILPDGPLKHIVRQLKLPRLSPFQNNGPCNNIPKCGLALTNFLSSYNNNYNKCCDLMTPNEIPDLYSFLTANGYQIDTQLTNMMNQSEVKLTNSRIVCSATYYGNKQPNIVYMK